MQSTVWPIKLREIFAITIRDVRLKKLQSRLGSLNEFVTIVHGVNGEELDSEDLKKQGWYRPPTKFAKLTRGELGCFLSHRAVWQRIVQLNLPYALIIEDDCTLNPTHAKEIQEGLDEFEDHSWNILFLGRNLALAQNGLPVKSKIVQSKRSWGLFCYAVSQQGARELLRHSYPLTMAVDIFVSTAPINHRYAFKKNICNFTVERSDTRNIR